MDAVFAFAEGGAGDDAVLVLEIRLGHGDGAPGGAEEGRAFAEQLDDLGPGFAGPGGQLLDLLLRGDFLERHSADRRQAGKGHHVGAVAAEDGAGDIGHRYAELHGDERPPTGGVQRAGHADDLMLGEAGQLVKGIDHSVERVGDDDAERLGSVLFDAVGNRGDDLEVYGEQVFPGHAGLAGLAGGDDHDVGSLNVLIGRGPDEVGIVVSVGGHLHQVQGFALGRIFELGDVEDDDIAEFLLGGEHGQDLADLAAADECDFLSRCVCLLNEDE